MQNHAVQSYIATTGSNRGTGMNANPVHKQYFTGLYLGYKVTQNLDYFFEVYLEPTYKPH